MHCSLFVFEWFPAGALHLLYGAGKRCKKLSVIGRSVKDLTCDSCLHHRFPVETLNLLHLAAPFAIQYFPVFA